MEAANLQLANTPLLVNLLRFIRNAREPLHHTSRNSAKTECPFHFGGLTMTDSGPFREAERVWATQRFNVEGSLENRGAAGSTFSGPLHLFVVIDKVTVEHWTLEDYREEHTESSYPHSVDKQDALEAFVRILFTFLRTQDVYRVVLQKAIPDRDDGAYGELWSYRHMDVEVPPGDGSPRAHVGSEVQSPVLSSVPSVDSTGRICDSGIRLRVLADLAPGTVDGRAASAKYTNLLWEACQDSAEPGRYVRKQWFLEDLLKVEVVSDSKWRTAGEKKAAAPSTQQPDKTSSPPPRDSETAATLAVAEDSVASASPTVSAAVPVQPDSPHNSADHQPSPCSSRQMTPFMQPQHSPLLFGGRLEGSGGESVPPLPLPPSATMLEHATSAELEHEDSSPSSRPANAVVPLTVNPSEVASFANVQRQGILLPWGNPLVLLDDNDGAGEVYHDPGAELMKDGELPDADVSMQEMIGQLCDFCDELLETEPPSDELGKLLLHLRL